MSGVLEGFGVPFSSCLVHLSRYRIISSFLAFAISCDQSARDLGTDSLPISVLVSDFHGFFSHLVPEVCGGLVWVRCDSELCSLHTRACDSGARD